MSSTKLTLPTRARVDLVLTWPTTCVAAVFAIGMVMVWLFVLKTAPFDDHALDKNATKLSGRILPPIQGMDWSVGGRVQDGGSHIYRYRISYEVDNTQYETFCFSTGKTHSEGKVDIEYLPKDPRIARIVGTRRGMMDKRVVSLSIIPALALLWLSSRLVKGLRTIRLLHTGRIAMGRIAEVRVSRTSNGGGPDRWYVAYDYEDAEGSTHHSNDVTPLLSEPKPGDSIDLIYPTSSPGKARYLGELVRYLEFAEDGAFQTEFNASSLLRVTVVAFSIGANLVYGLWIVLG